MRYMPMQGTFRAQELGVTRRLGSWVAKSESIVARAAGLHPQHAFALYTDELTDAVLVLEPERVRALAAPVFAPFLVTMRALLPDVSVLTPAVWIKMLTLASTFRALDFDLPDDVLQLCGDRASSAIINPSFDRMQSAFYLSGFAALSWNATDNYRAVCGVERGDAPPFRANARHGINRQSYLAQIAAASEQGRSWSDVSDTWHELLDRWPEMYAAESATSAMLLFAAEALQTRVRKEPIGDTAAFLYTSVLEADRRSVARGAAR